MSTVPALNNAVTGIMRGMSNMRINAAEIASADTLRGASTKDLATSMVEMMGHRNQVAASIKVASAVDRMLGSLIDIRA